MIESLQKEHQNLLQQQMNLRGRAAPQSDRVLAAKARGFVMRCIKESADVSLVKERKQLLDIIDHWGQFVYSVTRENLPSSLAPSVKGLTWVGMTWENLRDACRARAGSFVDDRISDQVFDPERAVPRKDVEKRIQQFLKGEHPAMVLIGEAGVGKTFLLCQMAYKSQEEDLRLILPYDAQDLAFQMQRIRPEQRDPLSDGIGRVIAQDLGYGDVAALEKELNYINHLLRDANSYLFICFDGVEQFRFGSQTAEHLLVAINILVERFASHQDDIHRIRFMMTSLRSSWDWLGAERLLSFPLYFLQEVKKNGGRHIAHPMPKFNENEFKQAYRKYTGLAPRGKAFREVKDICRGNPYLLRIAARLVEQRKSVTEQSVFDAFYEERVLRGSGDDQVRKERFLAAFIQNYDEQVGGVPASKVETTDPAYTMLSLDGILDQKKIRDPYTRIILILKPDGLTKYLQARFRPREATADYEPAMA